VEDKITSYIIIDGTRVPGRFSLTGRVVDNPPRVETTGAIETTAYLGDRYKEIRGGRLIVNDVSIVSENYGSETNNIVYEFRAARYTVLDAED
jgi:hypothetical protein